MLAGTKTIAANEHPDDSIKENVQLILNQCWRSQISVIGVEGLPTDIASAGNVIYKGMKFRCSMRIPAHLSSDHIVQTLREKLTAAGPETFGAILEFDCLDSGDGFDAPDLPAELKTPLNDASNEVFG